MSKRYDLVIYGASGFTGQYIVRYLVESDQFKGVSFAVAGRSEQKLRKVLSDVSDATGVNVRDVTVIVCDSSDESSLVEMAKQATVVINAVGPYRLHGEAVVKAAVENGASHIDISGEPAFLERMQMTYAETAKKNGVYVVGACGWDSVPADLGVHFLKRNFGGELNHVESFVQLNSGSAGYSFNAGTYQTLILGISQAMTDGLGKMRKAIMPEKLPRGPHRLPKRGQLWSVKEKELQGWALPFMGADKSIVNRSQYYDCVENKQRPVLIETYVRVQSVIWSVLLAAWLTVFAILCQYSWSRKLLQKYPDQCSFYLFKNSGPSAEQMAQASFVYWFFGYGWDSAAKAGEEHADKPSRRVVATCTGPDAGYIATSGCVLSCALALIKDKSKLPKSGGVFTTASAFGNTKIYEYLSSFGITYQLTEKAHTANM